jgi:HD superfamily phosphohydrolase
VLKIISSPLIRHLAGVTQLGLIVQIYPTATHSRLEHILGTFANMARYCDALWNDTANPLFKQIMTQHDINLALLCALFHDIGQYPLAHDLEEADSKLFSHVEIGELILNGDKQESITLRNQIKEEWGVEAQEIIEVLSADTTDHSLPLKCRLLHSLISGPIDTDKLDYLIRDSNNLNLPYGKSIDVERLLSCLTVVFQRRDVSTYIALGIHEKGEIPAEGLAFTRYAMFGTVYWHHSSRSLKSMLHRAVWEALPVGDRRSKEYKDFKDLFHKQITMLSYVKPVVQQKLFSEQPRSSLPHNPQLSLSDFEIISWT